MLTVTQRLIRALPRRSDSVANALGLMMRRRIRSTVNDATFRLDLREAIQRRMFLQRYEPAQTAWMQECLAPGDVFIDVGASFGYYTSLAAMIVGPSGRVFSFEPSPIANAVLDQAIRETPLTNVVLTKAALGMASGRIELHLPNTPYLHSPSFLASDQSFDRLEVKVFALDDFQPVAAIPHVKLIKIDVEGYEPNVLRGMRALCAARRIENIFCEFNSGWLRRNGTGPEELHELFTELGFIVKQSTAVERDLVGHGGERFDLQDVWYTRA